MVVQMVFICSFEILILLQGSGTRGVTGGRKPKQTRSQGHICKEIKRREIT